MKRLFLLLTALLLTLSIPMAVLAQSNFQSGETVVLSSTEVINKDYFAGGSNVSLNGTVNGDAYVAGGDVTLNGVINGDLLLAGGNLNINGTVTGNIRVAGGNISINSKVGRNITALGGSITVAQSSIVPGSVTLVGGSLSILAPIGKEANFAGGHVNIGNTIGGDVNAGVGQLTLSPEAKINGNVTYWSDQKADINPAASVSGSITQNQPPKSPESPKVSPAGFFTFFKVFSFLSALIVGLVLIRLLPNFTSRLVGNVNSKLFSSLGIGFLALAITPLLMILLFITLIGVPLAFLWLFFIIFSLWLSKIFISLAIGEYLKKYFKQTWSVYWVLPLGLLIYYVIDLIPVIGWLFNLLAVLTGLGAMVLIKKQYYQELHTQKMI